MSLGPLRLRCASLAGVALVLAACAGPAGPPASKPRKTVLLTQSDDTRVGRESSAVVRSEMGILEDPALVAYVDGIGRKLLRGIPLRGFEYQFFVADLVEPNAFALPGGYIFISRGLLALVNSEDELACVIGHEITHAAHRHAAAQQGLEKSTPSLMLPRARGAKLAAYSREMERDADEGGQILCAAAGYDPMGLSTFLTGLGQLERLSQATTRAPGFFDTHPGSEERAAANAVRAREIRWQRDASRPDPRDALLRHIDGLPIGQRVESGVFQGDRFLHPELGFTLRFPPGWMQSNSNRAVGAAEPRGEAIVFLSADAPSGDVARAAESWVAKARDEAQLEVKQSKRVVVGGIDAWQLEARGRTQGGLVEAQLTFVPFRGANLLITGVAPAQLAARHRAALQSSARSFRALTPGDLRAIQATRLRVSLAQAGESLVDLGRRSGNLWSLPETAVHNGIFSDHRFQGGERVKIAHREPIAAH